MSIVNRPPMLLLEGVPSQQVPYAMPFIQEMLQECIDLNEGEFTLADTYQKLVSREWQLWLGVQMPRNIKSVAVTEIVNYPSKKVCRIVMVAGEGLEFILSLSDHLKSWAQEFNCTSFEVWCRPGMAKVLQRRLCFVPKYQVLTLDITRSLQ